MTKRYKARAIVEWDFEIDGAGQDLMKLAAEQLSNILVPPFTLTRISQIVQQKQRVYRLVLGEFTPEEVLPFITHTDTKKEYTAGKKQYLVRMNSHRYFVFHANRNCAACGIKGTKMLLEMHPNDKAPHFNLYAEENGELVLMTKDHICPASIGGRNEFSNYQSMCAICNNLKASCNLSLDAIRELRQLFDANKNKVGKRALTNLIVNRRKELEVPRTEHSAMKIEGLIANCDLHVLETPGGALVGMSVYDSISEELVPVACIKRGTVLFPIKQEGECFDFPFNEAFFTLYQGLTSSVKCDRVLDSQ